MLHFITAALVAHTGTLPANEFEEARAVIERRCLSCHGGDHRRSELSFADAETFHHGGARGSVIDLENLDRSRLLRVVSYVDPSLAMPPDGLIPEDEREALKRWVLAGAEWPEGEAGRLADPAKHPLDHGRPKADGPWWAYDPLVEPETPEVAAFEAQSHPVDAFIWAGYEARELAAPSFAERNDLLRRATFDLTGLPPTTEERRAFEEQVRCDGFDAAWSALLDRLFASPHYGEAQARHWLDLVRYAETNGYERDTQKPNVWRYRDWVVRAFNRDLPYDTFIKHQLAGDEYARTMDSPFDADEARIATGFHRLTIWDDEPVDRAQAHSDERADIVDTISQVVFGTTMGCARCHDHKADPVTQREYFELTAHFTGVTAFRLDGHRPIADRPSEGVMTLAEREAEVARVEAAIGERTKAAGIAGPLEAEEPVTLVADARGEGAEWAYRMADADDGWTAPGYDDGEWKRGRSGFGAPGTPESRVGTEWRKPHIQLRTTFGLEEIPSALAMSLHYDDDVEVWINGVSVFTAKGYVVAYDSYQLPAAALDALVVGRNVVAVSCLQDFGGQYVDVGLRTGFDRDAKGAWKFLAEVAARGGATDVDELLAERDRVLAAPYAAPYPAQVVTERGPNPPKQHVELRGSVHAKADEVQPGVPAAWLTGSKRSTEYAAAPPPEGASTSFRRHALAEWAFDGGEHITARVEANRTWQFLFGRGLCRTPGDFGRLGEKPTHPELLDRIAVELIRRDWSRKSLQRWLMESRFYRSASQGAAASAAADPRNDGLWRFPSRRLTAEEFRDATLAISGELNPELYGPWVYPPLAAEVLATSSRPNQAWGRATPEEAVRRSLYVHVKRSLREPLLAVMDQPDPDLPCPERFPTNVPTQALLTLNGDFAQARATAMASFVSNAAPSTEERIEVAIERALGRDANEEEVARATAFLDDLTNTHSVEPDRALALFCLGLFNRNEFLWID